mmetsp:Transcript_2579/g.6198  ORF Transcript_2579/g.6198 Transcript_2579/m.6198 type:complete len:101 (-) Transcript_2579:479-781(-)
MAQSMKELRGHGVDPACIPINEQGEISDHLEYGRGGLEQQRKYERLNYPPRRIIGTPSTKDVLLGKGVPFQIHSGRLYQIGSRSTTRHQKGQRRQLLEKS